MPVLKPKLLTTLRPYSLRQLRADCVAGVIVGIVALLSAVVADGMIGGPAAP
ncbi:MAG: hypothetical protein HY600_04715 [Candidatus Omnitrophica bacterium]|nr:hypothetical protein [Candidatus Omnitrophota bacterium]